MFVTRLLPVLALVLLAACGRPEGGPARGSSSAAATTLSAADALAKGVPVAELQAALQRGDFTAAQLTQAALDAIKAGDGELHSVIVVNPDALAQARAIDEARKAGKSLGPLMGIPVLIKDNVETSDNMATTAGSLALKDNITRRDAPVVARLRAGGAIILGKTNLSEWANIRSTRSMSGWSAVGGLVANPHDKARTACGSSSGSGAAVAADFAPLAVGTETDGSVTCPASMNGLVGLKPTVGLVSRTHVVPISHSQDTPGPMGRSVSDVAAMMTVMAGSDPADVATMEADKFRSDYAAGLSKDYLKGLRVGVLRDRIGSDPKTAAVFEAALKTLTDAGAVLVDIKESQVPGLDEAEWTVLQYELKADLNTYLATTPAVVKTRTLADVIAFNKANAEKEMPFFGQEFFEQAQARGDLRTREYVLASVKAKTSSALKLDGLLKTNNVTVLVAPTYGPAWMSDPIWGDQYPGPSATQLPATSGYPHLTVPMGDVQGLPVGLSFIGPKWSEATLLKAGYAFEKARK
ncbi:amidase [Asticcacaulis sp. AC402]|uniref:amidase n=1 Tax=Asticcacaulis sp. AC402 TaxID=1282361 RepID=UPI0003C3DE9E|nr:amidase [Asticcacaulis sp. AC402]ESQ73911.1 amidase [Asticcacaulis sp. AC402]